ncbi:hypothetical protein [Reichenbachiella versicolor]|uniref:hypothetical protein n=1 Tax=Reichenbachiella versicolor TaxID=1821036 RepID=UPI000D6E56F6|nr:hypothetical protein [Reichenbachiella versicolor]
MKYFFVTGLLLITSLSVVAQRKEAESKTVESLKLIHPSFSGNAENCIPYDVYAFKYKKSWIIALNESENVDAFILNAPRAQESTYIASFHFTEGLGKIVPNTYYYKQKNKRKVVNDLELYPYYKMKWSGKKAMNGLLYIEIADTTERPKFFLWKVFSKKQEDLKSEAGSLKPNFEQAISGVNDQAEQEATQALTTPSVEEVVPVEVPKKGWLFGKK